MLREVPALVRNPNTSRTRTSDGAQTTFSSCMQYLVMARFVEAIDITGIKS